MYSTAQNVKISFSYFKSERKSTFIKKVPAEESVFGARLMLYELIFLLHSPENRIAKYIPVQERQHDM